MNASDDVWNHKYGLPTGIGDVIGTVAHACVGLGAIAWGTRTLRAPFVPPSWGERAAYLWAGFWEALGPVIMVADPATCYHSMACKQRNVTHLLATGFLWFGVLWDVLLHLHCHRRRQQQLHVQQRWSSVPLSPSSSSSSSSAVAVAAAPGQLKMMILCQSLGIGLWSNLVPAYLLYAHDHDTMTTDDDSENVLHQNAALAMALVGILRLILPWIPSLHVLHGAAMITLGYFMMLAGPSIREWWVVHHKLSGANLSGMAMALSAVTMLLMLLLPPTWVLRSLLAIRWPGCGRRRRHRRRQGRRCCWPTCCCGCCEDHHPVATSPAHLPTTTSPEAEAVVPTSGV